MQLHLGDEPGQARRQAQDALAALDVPFQGYFGPRCVECPSCGAAPGVGCKRPSGHQGPLVGPHAARAELAGRVRLVGLACAHCGAPDGPGRYVAPVLDSPEAQAMGIVGARWCWPCVEAAAELAGVAP